MHAPSLPRRVALLAVAPLAVALPCAAPSAAVLPFENTGQLYVSMWDADEIAVFAEDGTPVTRFSAPGLDGPRGLAFHPEKDELWVAGELDDALHVFDGEHRLLRTIRHPDLDGPVGITFAARSGPDAPLDVYVSNSDRDEILVLGEDGRPLRRVSDPSLRDPGCSAFMPDGTLFVANRLGGTTNTGGAVARFGTDDGFEFDFTTAGLASTMAVARDPNLPGDPLDDTLWVSSGAGSLGVHEFDTAGNLLRSVLPGDVPGGDDLVPQGIAFADDGRFFVVSFRNAVFEFDGDGRFLSRFPTGPGTSRSTAFRRCDGPCTDLPDAGSSSETPAERSDGDGTADGGGGSTGGGGGGGAPFPWILALVLAVRAGGRRSSSGDGSGSCS